MLSYVATKGRDTRIFNRGKHARSAMMTISIRSLNFLIVVYRIMRYISTNLTKVKVSLRNHLVLINYTIWIRGVSLVKYRIIFLSVLCRYQKF